MSQDPGNSWLIRLYHSRKLVLFSVCNISHLQLVQVSPKLWTLSDACSTVVSQVCGNSVLEPGYLLSMLGLLKKLEPTWTKAISMSVPASTISMASRKCLVKVPSLTLNSQLAQRKPVSKESRLMRKRDNTKKNKKDKPVLPLLQPPKTKRSVIPKLLF